MIIKQISNKRLWDTEMLGLCTVMPKPDVIDKWFKNVIVSVSTPHGAVFDTGLNLGALHTGITSSRSPPAALELSWSA